METLSIEKDLQATSRTLCHLVNGVMCLYLRFLSPSSPYPAPLRFGAPPMEPGVEHLVQRIMELDIETEGMVKTRMA